MIPKTPYQGMTDNFDQHRSVALAMTGNLSMGEANAWDTNNYPTNFTQNNMNGNLFRVGPGYPNTWGTANTDTTITHNLGRVPVGYIVVRKNQTLDVYDGGTLGWTTAVIVLRCTIANPDTTLYIF